VLAAGQDLETERLGEAQHAGVGGEHVAVDLAHVAVARGLDERLHELAAKSLALVRVAHEDGELGLFGVRRLDREAGDAQHLRLLLALRLRECGDRDLAVVVDVAVAHEHRLGDLLHRPEKAVHRRLGGQRFDHLGPCRFVLGADRAHGHLLAIERRLPLILAGIHRDHQVGARQDDLAHLLGLDDDARVQDAEAIGSHLDRVGVHLDDLGEVDEKVAELDERLLESDKVDGGSAAVAAQQL